MVAIVGKGTIVIFGFGVLMLFRQLAHYGLSKREFMPHRSSNPHESVSNEIKLLNYSNYQQQPTHQNIDDIASDILILKQKS